METEDDIEKLAQKEAVNYIIDEIIELSGNVARDHNKSIINNYHIWKAIYNDKELLQTITNLDDKLPKIPMNIEEDFDAREVHRDEYEFSYTDIEIHLYTTRFGFSDLGRKTIHDILLQASNIYNTSEKIKNKIAELSNCDSDALNDMYTISDLHNILINTLVDKINESDTQLHAMCGYKSMSFYALCEAVDACEVFDYLDQIQPKN